MTDKYTVYLYDWCTFTKLTQIPVTSGLTFSSILNDAGSCQFTLALVDPNIVAAYTPVANYRGIPPACFIDRDGVIVWGGFLYAGNYQGNTQELTLSGKEFLGYFNQRTIAASYDQSTYPSGIDPAQLLYKALTDAVAVTGSWNGFTVTGATSTVPAYVPGYTKTQFVTVEQVISDVTGASTPGYGGVDLSITTSWPSGGVGGTPVVTMAVISPRAGRSASQTGLIFDLDSATEWTWPWDFSQSGSNVIAVGSGSGATQPTSIQSSPQAVGGLGQAPLTNIVLTYNQIQTQAQIARVAQGATQVYGQAITTPTLTIPTAYPPNGLGSWLMGDDARLYLGDGLDPFFATGLDQFWRIVQQEVSVPAAGLPTVTLTFNPPPVF